MPVVVRGVQDLRSAAAALQTVDKDVRTEVRRHVSAGLPGIWNRGELNSHPVQGRAQSAMLDPASTRTKARNNSVTLEATSEAEARGLTYQWWEFGTKRQAQKSTYSRRSPKGKRHQVTRRTRAHLPRFVKGGRRYWPTIADATPRVISLYTQTVIRTIAEALEGRR